MLQETVGLILFRRTRDRCDRSQNLLSCLLWEVPDAAISCCREGSGFGPRHEECDRFTPGASKGTGGFYTWCTPAPLHWHWCSFHGAVSPWTAAVWCLLRYQPLLAKAPLHCCCSATAMQLLQCMPRVFFLGLHKDQGESAELVKSRTKFAMASVR